MTDAPASAARPASRLAVKLAVGAGAAVLVGLFLWQFRDLLDLEALGRSEDRLRAFGRAHPVLLIGVAVGLYVATTALSIPGATVLTLTYGWLFPTIYGAWPGFLAAVATVGLSAATGATLALLLSRFLFRGAVRRRFPERIAAFDARFREDGPFYLFSLRLFAGVPFFVVNAAMGLTPIRPWTFWWVSLLGMLPGTLIYTYAGSQLPSLSALAERGAGGVVTWQLLVALALLGVFPLALKKLYSRFGPASVGSGGVRL